MNKGKDNQTARIQAIDCPAAGVVGNVELGSCALLRDGSAKKWKRFKRVFDLVLVCLSFPVWGLIMAVIALWVKAVSDGPILYRQARIGHGFKGFMLLKFRSMHPNADTRPHEQHFSELIRRDVPMSKMDSLRDFRLIRGARLLRASGLDELPQLINILRGEMSIVGPRPCTVSESVHYDESHRRRFDVLPGVTGYWQVNGKNRTTFKEMLALDIYYAENLSLWLDVKILFKTIGTIFAQVRESSRPKRSVSAEI